MTRHIVENVRVAINVRWLTLATAAIVVSEVLALPVAGAYASTTEVQQQGYQVAASWHEPGPSVARSRRGHRNQNFSAVNSPTIQRGVQQAAISIGQTNKVQGAICKRKRHCRIHQRIVD